MQKISARFAESFYIRSGLLILFLSFRARTAKTACDFMNDEIKYGRNPLEVGHFIVICIGIILGGVGIVLTSVGWWLLGFVLVSIGLAYFGVNEMLGEE